MKNVLIVDDEETVRVTLSEWFSTTYGSHEYKVFLASNGIEAIKLLAVNSIDLLITDLNMPKMDGFELLAQMKSDHPRIPIIVISAFSTPDIKTKVVDLGALRFIPKPFSFSDLDGINFPKLLESAPKKSDRGYVNGISLQSFLQLISMEAKSCTLTVRSEGKTGEIFLERGELMDARTGKLEGEEASYEIISWSDEGLTIEIDNVCRAKERKIEFPIMHLLMEGARMADEKAIEAESRDEDEQNQGIGEKTVILKAEQLRDAIEAEEVLPEPVTEPEPPPLKPASQPDPPQTAHRPGSQPSVAGTPAQEHINLSRLSLVKIQERCKEFAALDGFAGAVLLTVNGDILQVVGSDGTSINLERASIYANNILSTAQIHAKNMGLGVTNLIQVDTTGGHLIIAGRAKINLMLVLVTSSSLGLAKIMVNSAIKDICTEIGG